jgi:hypothetical protein
MDGLVGQALIMSVTCLLAMVILEDLILMVVKIQEIMSK